MAFLINNPVFMYNGWENNHPLAISRHKNLFRIIETNGWLLPDLVKTCPLANKEELSSFHDIEYIEALESAVRTNNASQAIRDKFNFGTFENPIFPTLYERACATIGGSIMAANLVKDGGIVFHPAGGTHHGQASRASGFCYFNDPVFAIQGLLNQDLARVLYVDIDAHHGDGVEMAFENNDRVFLVSLHEENRWPFSGIIEGNSRPNILNLPLPSNTNDSEYLILFDAIYELVQIQKPDAIFIVAGADALQGDPLSKLQLSNAAFWQIIETLISYSKRNIILGGGGYNPWTSARAWAGLWAKIAGFEIGNINSREVKAILSAMECDLIDDDEIQANWINSLIDRPNYGAIRPIFDTLKNEIVAKYKMSPWQTN